MALRAGCREIASKSGLSRRIRDAWEELHPRVLPYIPMASEKKAAAPVRKAGGPGRMDPVQRARYLAYQQPSKSVAASLTLTQNRLREHAARSLSRNQRPAPDPERERRAVVVGQLKAAEARDRDRLMRLRFQCSRAQELSNLIACQPTARDAIRLEVFLSPQPRAQSSSDPLRRSEREYVESLLQDDRGLHTNRIP